MGIISFASDLFSKKNTNVEHEFAEESFEEIKSKLIKQLKDLKVLEAKLWGVTINHLSYGEESVLEDTNHLIHKFEKSNRDQLHNYFDSKEVKEFLDDLRNLKSDFLMLKKEIKDKNKLKNQITAYTIKLVDKDNYDRLEEVFLLEKQLYEVIEVQNDELDKLVHDVSKIKISIGTKDKVEFFIEALIKLRKILAGHMDHHTLWEEEKQGYSNTSNIVSSLLKIVEEIE